MCTAGFKYIWRKTNSKTQC